MGGGHPYLEEIGPLWPGINDGAVQKEIKCWYEKGEEMKEKMEKRFVF